jgi:hypothetical protein
VATYVDDTNGARKSLPFGAISNGDDACEGFYVRHEIESIIIMQDYYEVKGIVLRSEESDVNYIFKTSDIEYPDPNDSDTF